MIGLAAAAILLAPMSASPLSGAADGHVSPLPRAADGHASPGGGPGSPRCEFGAAAARAASERGGRAGASRR